MLFWYFLVIVALIWITFATITDIKKREVPDWLNYSLIAIGLGSRLIYSLITGKYSYILYGLLGAAIFFGIANFMYYTKQWGGGDGKLLIGLGAMFGNYETTSLFNPIIKLPFLATLIINIIIAGTVYGLLYAAYLGSKNSKNFFKEFKKQNFKHFRIIIPIIILSIVVFYFILDRNIFIPLSLLLLVLVSAILLIQIIKVIEDISLYKMIDVKKLVEGDWLASDVIKNNKIICKVRNIGLTKEDIIGLKKNKINKVLVKEGIPFIPGFLFGFIISIVFGDLLFLFF
ncbi:prepilin peptidase [Candidatus Woesearchaeota archaeon]|nr:prepilin peptidase [Candidatus Woesearchaeota archaeon]